MLDLQSIEQIKQLKARYFRFLDTGNFEQLVSVFSEGVTAHFQGGYYEFKLEGRDALIGFYRDSFTSEKFGTHNVHHPEITVEGDQAQAIWYLQDTFYNLEEKRVTSGSAFYRDNYERRDGEWLITHTGYERVFESVTALDENQKITVRPIKN